MSDIFISYANKDRPRAQMFVQALEGRGWSIFWDRTIPVGKTWRETIGEELREARCVIVLWSRTSVASDWVHEEADDAKRRGILVPVPIENVQPPIGFRSIQTADLVNWDATVSTQTFSILTAGIAALIRSPPKEVEGEVEAEAGGRRSQGENVIAARPRMSGLGSFFGSKTNRALIVWLGGGIVIVIAGLWTAFVYFNPPKGDGGGSSGNCGISSGGIASGNNTVNCGTSPAAPTAKP
jgi:TIR domain